MPHDSLASRRATLRGAATLGAAVALLLASSLRGQQWTRPERGAAAAPAAWTYKLGRLTENRQSSLNPAPYVIQEGTFGGRYFVLPDENLDLAQYVDQDIVVRGTLRPTNNPRHKLFVVDRVFSRPAGSRAVVIPTHEDDMELSSSAAEAVEADVAQAAAEEPVTGGEPPPSGEAAEPRPFPMTSSITLRSLDEAAEAELAEAELVPADSAVPAADERVGSGLAEHVSRGRSRSAGPWQDVDVFGDSEPATRAASFQARLPQNSRQDQNPPAGAEEVLPSTPEPRGGTSRQALQLPPPQELDLLGDDYFADHGHAGGSCPHCGSPTWGGSCGHGCGSPEWIWLRGEYLHWWTSGLDLPPLVTTSTAGTGQADAGVVGHANTSLAFGGGEVNDTSHSGFRARGGSWLGSGKRFGLEGDYLRLDDQQANFSDTSAGAPILARPYFNIVDGEEAAALIAFPNVVRGSVDAEAITRFQAIGARIRWNLFCRDGQYEPNVYPRIVDGDRIDWFLGYRYAKLNDQVSVTESRTLLDNSGSSWRQEQFITGNEFHGGDVGFLYERRAGRWLIDGVTRVAIGNNHQVVDIHGLSRITSGATTQSHAGHVLAQRSNNGFYTRNELAVIPELGVTVGFQLTNHTRLTAGYSFVYFSNVVRAGDQIDRDVNPGLIPPESNPFSGPLRPEFQFRETDFWAQGLNLGVDVRF